MTGSALNLPTPLTVHQDGQADVSLSAQFDTNPFGDEAPYYAWRVGLWKDGQAWEFEHIHHKLYLTNTTAEVQDFELCHGANYFLLGHAWNWSNFIFHLGLGPLVTHPQSIIRGVAQNSDHGGLFNAGYYFSGMGTQAALGRNFGLTSNLYLLLEVSVVGGWAWWAPTAGGWSEVWNLGLHGHVGVGVHL